MKNFLAARLSRNNVILGLCVLGIIATAVWSASVGRMDNYSNVLKPKTTALNKFPAKAQPSLAAGAYNSAGLGNNAADPQSKPGVSLEQASMNNQNVQASLASSTSNPPAADPAAPPPAAEPDILYPIDPPGCRPAALGGVAYCIFCDSSQTTADSTICGGCYGGRGIKPDIMCAY